MLPGRTFVVIGAPSARPDTADRLVDVLMHNRLGIDPIDLRSLICEGARIGGAGPLRQPRLRVLHGVDGIIGDTGGPHLLCRVLDRAVGLLPALLQNVGAHATRVVHGLPPDQRVQLVESPDVLLKVPLPTRRLGQCRSLI